MRSPTAGRLQRPSRRQGQAAYRPGAQTNRNYMLAHSATPIRYGPDHRAQSKSTLNVAEQKATVADDSC